MSDNIPQPELAPIPVPWRVRWREIRLRVIPVLVFSFSLGGIAYLWKDHVAAPSMVGQAEPVLSNVSSHKPGILAELKVVRFQKVKAGDVIGQVMVTDPKILTATLAVIQSEIEMLRAEMKPIVTQQRNAMNYDQLRLDWMKERATLAQARVSLQLAETEFKRTEELFRDQIVSQRVFEQAKASRDRVQSEVDELSNLVAEGAGNLERLQISNSVDLATISMTPQMAQLAVEEAKLKLTEAELSPIVLTAPIDGTVNTVMHRAGEAVTAGQPVVTIATLSSVRIVGYLRPPVLTEPKPGMRVEVRSRGLKREVGLSRIKEVGTQLEPLPPSMLGPAKAVTSEVGLPVDIELPGNMNIRPGELVDIILLTKAH